MAIYNDNLLPRAFAIMTPKHNPALLGGVLVYCHNVMTCHCIFCLYFVFYLYFAFGASMLNIKKVNSLVLIYSLSWLCDIYATNYLFMASR